MKKLLVLVFLIIATGIFCTKAERLPEENSTENQGEVASLVRTFIDIDISVLETSETGDEIRITLDEGSSYSLLIQRKEEVMPGITNISAYVNDRETGQAVLVFRDGKLAGSVNMFSEGTSYNLGYDEESDQHFIAPVDPTKKDALPGGKPLEAPKKDG